MTMVTHKTLFQPLRLHYIIESNAGGGRREEGGGNEGGKEKEKEKGRKG